MTLGSQYEIANSFTDIFLSAERERIVIYQPALYTRQMRSTQLYGDETERTRTHPLELHEAKGHTTMSTSTHPLVHPASFLPHPGKPVW